jgi:hypothetical protein
MTISTDSDIYLLITHYWESPEHVLEGDVDAARIAGLLEDCKAYRAKMVNYGFLRLLQVEELLQDFAVVFEGLLKCCRSSRAQFEGQDFLRLMDVEDQLMVAAQRLEDGVVLRRSSARKVAAARRQGLSALYSENTTLFLNRGSDPVLTFTNGTLFTVHRSIKNDVPEMLDVVPWRKLQQAFHQLATTKIFTGHRHSPESRATMLPGTNSGDHKITPKEDGDMTVLAAKAMAARCSEAMAPALLEKLSADDVAKISWSPLFRTLRTCLRDMLLTSEALRSWLDQCRKKAESN